MALTADVVIIGGGVTGTSIAFHLTARGVRDVIVVDKSFVASGATGKSSACVRQHYSTPETCRMIRFSLDRFQRFEELTGGHSCGFRRTGYLLGVDERMRPPMETSVALQRSVGIETRLVAPSDMREIEPRLQTEDLVAGCYEPDSGYCNPAETAQGFARAARERGARVLEEAEALAVLTEGSRVTGVRTSRGEILAPRVVNAAGLWGARVGAMLGLDIPITVCRHKISIVTWPEASRRPHPMVYDFVTNIYTRPEMGEHILVGGLDAEESHDVADPDRYKEGVSLDESTDALARVSHRFPVLAEGRIARGYAGCFDVTPDWHPIMDQAGPEGSYVAVGFSGHGFKLSPAVGHMMAAMVTEGPDGHPDLPAFRLSRFAEGKPIRGTYGDWLMG
ncbi:MAG: FAD-dependent oxidoreductase [Candidatus Rokuibacteriota bacterium]|nr:MAG: FAD-dependent oxidoreductase [Candidatus Rokubacteria bacterium]